MSDDDRDIDIESDEGDDSDSRSHSRQSSNLAGGYYSQAEKRAHHNALERKRRDHIKDSFTSLRDSVPALHGEKVASRAQILKKAADYIQFMRHKNSSHQQDIDDLKRQNTILEQQIKQLEKVKATGNYMVDANDVLMGGIKSEGSSHGDTDSSDGEGPTRRVKKLKINGITVNA
ncbi:MYC associated factor X isoform X2 [Arctopsyche grandis]|uniref:MYC associated factor X isoform X2 n=1 Tax=Arctopsyche grandis TaxID=121162 RepID=UPI00406D9707